MAHKKCWRSPTPNRFTSGRGKFLWAALPYLLELCTKRRSKDPVTMWSCPVLAWLRVTSQTLVLRRCLKFWNLVGIFCSQSEIFTWTPRPTTGWTFQANWASWSKVAKWLTLRRSNTSSTRGSTLDQGIKKRAPMSKYTRNLSESASLLMILYFF